MQFSSSNYFGFIVYYLTLKKFYFLIITNKKLEEKMREMIRFYLSVPFRLSVTSMPFCNNLIMH